MNTLVFVTALLGVAIYSANAAVLEDTVAVALNSTRYCVGASWNLKVSNAAPTAAIRLIGTSNGTAWEIARWASTDVSGTFITSGTFAIDAAGKHTLRVEIAGVVSDLLFLEVVTCGWRNTTSLNTARSGHAATLLADGTLLVTGGWVPPRGFFEDPGAIDSAELYNPVTETWSVTGKLNRGRFSHTATLLPNGKVLVAGGAGVRESPTAPISQMSAELYDPQAESWSFTGSLSAPRSEHTATLLPNGQILVVGGWNAGTLNTAALYDPETGTWRMTGSLPFGGRWVHTVTLLPNGKVLLVGGASDGDFTAEAGAALYNPATETWSATGSLKNPRLSHTAILLPNGKVLVGGGGALRSSPKAEVYDPETGTWSVASGDPDFQTAILLPNGKVLFLGANDNQKNLYDPDTGILTDAPASTPRHGYTATLLSSGKVLLAGGNSVAPVSVALETAELYDGGFEIPLLLLDSNNYCVGASWTLTATHAMPAASVRLIGISNGASWEIARWGTAGADGSFRATGTFADGTEGIHTLSVEISGVRSNAFSFAVSKCNP